MSEPGTITLCYSPGSCSFAPHVVLNEIGCRFELRKFSTADGGNYTPEYLAINPKARIPALMIDGFVLTENPAILAYLGRRFSDAGLYPSSSGESEARCLEWLAWCSNTVHVAFAQIWRPERFIGAANDYPAVIARGHDVFRTCLRDIESHLSQNDFALGSQYSVVDPFLLVFYRWAVRVDYEMRQDFPSYTRFAEALCERPAVKRALSTEGISVWKSAHA
jgi:glutathione S-transferase